MLAGPALLTARFAMGVTVVPTGGVILLAGIGSAVEAVTVATLVIVPLIGAVTVRVKFVTRVDG